MFMIAEAKTLGTTNGEGMVGETTRMSCKYQGKPIPDIRWLRQGKVIETDDLKYRITVDNDSSEKEVTSFLEIIGYVRQCFTTLPILYKFDNNSDLDPR